MTGTTNDTATQLARAVWFLGLVAKRMRTRTNGVAVVFLPAGYVAALRELTGSTASPTSSPPVPPTPSPTRGPTVYLAACGAEACTNNDVWETDMHGSACPVCGNTAGNVYDRLAELLTEEDLFGPVIHAYTRAQAIADGVLIDVSRLSSEAGFRFPAAMTAAAWEQAVAWPDDQDAGQSEEGRLWDVVYMAAYAARSRGGSELLYTLGVVSRGGHEPETVQLKCVVGPGDDGEPVVTIMLPEES